EEVPTDVIAYVRSAEGQRLLVITNFEGNEHTLDLSFLNHSGKVLLSSQFTKSARVSLSKLLVKPHESLLIRLI
ncbi:MAG: alpha-glucosidase C-terminal domain-containing protein, partial [bacterium]